MAHMHIHVDMNSHDTHIKRLTHNDNSTGMVRGSLLLVGWILEQPQSSAWQDLSLETHTLASMHTHAQTHIHTIQMGNQTSAPGKKCSNGFLATNGVYWFHMKKKK